MVNESDEIIYGRFLKERKNADFAVLLERHRDNLLLFVNGFVHNLEDAEDIMLDAFAATAAGPVLFEGRSSFKTWLYGIARNKALMHLRKHKYEAGVALEDVEEPVSDEKLPEANIILSEQKKTILNALKALQKDYRDTLYLIYFEDMSHDQVAKVLKKTKKQVYNLANRGRERLREILGKKDDLL